MNKIHYYLLGAFFLVVGIVLAVLGLKYDIEKGDPVDPDHDENESKGYIAMMVIGFVLIVCSFVLFILGYRKSEN